MGPSSDATKRISMRGRGVPQATPGCSLAGLMSGTAPGPEFPPPGGDAPAYQQPTPAGFQYPPPAPPRPQRPDKTVRNLLITLLVAVVTLVPATGYWVIQSVRDKSSDDSAAPVAKGVG